MDELPQSNLEHHQGGAVTVFLRAWRAWKEFARVTGDLFARVVLTALYFTLVTPFGLGVRLLNGRSASRLGRGSSWANRVTRDRTIEDARRQF